MVNLLHQQVVGYGFDGDVEPISDEWDHNNGSDSWDESDFDTGAPEALLCWKRVQRHLLECKTLEIPDLMDSAILPIVSYTSRKI